MFVKTICPYCGVGCSIILEIKSNRIVKTHPDKKDPVSKGKPCIKGLTVHETIYNDRIKRPMVRKGKKLVEVSWKEAYNKIFENIRCLDGEDIALYCSSPATNEDAFLFQKLGREVFGTGNIDSCARLCHAATCYAFKETFGISAMPSRLSDIDKGDCFLITGSNPKTTYPVVFNKILEAKKKGAKVICVRQWSDDSVKESDLFVDIANGAHIPFLNSVLHLLVKEKAVKVPEHIAECVSNYPPKKAAQICKCQPSEIEEVAEAVKESKNFCLFYGMGLTQHSYGVSNVFSALNLVLAKKGKIFPMRGKANIQGVGDMGCVPDGLTFISSVFLFPAKAFYIVHSDPAKSLPYLDKVHERLKKSFVVLQTTYPCLTMKFADVVLPSCSFAEKEGTFTNAESRIRELNRAVKPLHKSKPDWVIFSEIAERFGFKFSFNSIKDIQKEIKKRVPGYFRGNFVKRKIKKEVFHVAEFPGFESIASKEFPFILTTARRPYTFCSNTLSSRSKTLKKFGDKPVCYMNPKDASSMKIKNKSRVRITSCVSSITATAKISKNIPKGLVVVPFHFDKVLVNKLFPLQFDATVEEPNLKRVAVKIKAVS